MPAVSEKQRKMMAIAKHHPGKLYKRNRGVLSMSASQLSDFATSRTGHSTAKSADGESYAYDHRKDRRSPRVSMRKG